MSITNLIDQINDKLLDIKDNLGVDKDASLDAVNAAIDKLKSAATSEKQQIVILYTYAKDDEGADSKKKPIFEWEANNTAKITEEGDWTPIKPTRKSNDEVLYVRFVSVSEDSEPDYGVPIRLTGEKGDKGDKGSNGLNAVALGSSVIIKLYTKNEPKETPTITFDTDSYKTNGEIVENIKVGNDKLNSSDWTSTLGSDESGYEITIKVTVDKPDVEILAGPTATIPAIDSVTNQYMRSDNKDSCDAKGEWSDEYLNVSDEAPYLWSRTCTTYATGQKFLSKPFLITQLPAHIKSIEVTYAASDSVTKQPDTWTQDVPKGTVIWKREITTFSDNNLKEVICPMSIQGEPGIKYVGSYNSADELIDINLDYDNEFIGRIGVVVAGDTYVWYGTDDPNLGENCVQINNNYWWLKLGNLTPSMIEILYEDLVKLRDEGKLIPGMQYRITDYETTCADNAASTANHFFDIIVTANSNRALSEKARAEHSERDVDRYFNTSNLRAWEIWYRIDNDVNTFDWADSENGKGIIYRMIDEYGNDCPYDFKNILYKLGWESGKYTFCGIDDHGEYCDLSVGHEGDALAKNNIIEGVFAYDSSITLPNIVLYGESCVNNHIGAGCKTIIIEMDNIRNVIIGTDCQNIGINASDGKYIIGSGCKDLSVHNPDDGYRYQNVEYPCINVLPQTRGKVYVDCDPNLIAYSFMTPSGYMTTQKILATVEY